MKMLLDRNDPVMSCPDICDVPMKRFDVMVMSPARVNASRVIGEFLQKGGCPVREGTFHLLGRLVRTFHVTLLCKSLLRAIWRQSPPLSGRVLQGKSALPLFLVNPVEHLVRHCL